MSLPPVVQLHCLLSPRQFWVNLALISINRLQSKLGPIFCPTSKVISLLYPLKCSYFKENTSVCCRPALVVHWLLWKGKNTPSIEPLLMFIFLSLQAEIVQCLNLWLRERRLPIYNLEGFGCCFLITILFLFSS